MKNKFIKISIVLSSFLSSAIIKPIETSIADMILVYLKLYCHYKFYLNQEAKKANKSPYRGFFSLVNKSFSFCSSLAFSKLSLRKIKESFGILSLKYNKKKLVSWLICLLILIILIKQKILQIKFL
ncbi:hypothetical protein ACJ5FF_001665 [Campylobacter coli]